MSFSPVFKVLGEYGYFYSEWYFSTRSEAAACGEKVYYKWGMTAGFMVTEYDEKEHPVNSKWDFEKNDFYEQPCLQTSPNVSPETSPDALQGRNPEDQGSQSEKIEINPQGREVISKKQIKDVIAWCDQKSSEGKEVKVVFEGYDVTFMGLFVDNVWVDGEEVGEKVGKKLHILLEEATNFFHSGQFIHSGNAIYNPTTKTFNGLNIEDQGFGSDFVVQGEIKIRVPRSTSFESLEIGTDEDGHYVRFDFCEEVTDTAVKESITQFQPTLDKLNTDPDHLTVVGFGENIISRSEFIEDGDDLVYVLKEINLKKKDIYREKIELDLIKLLN